MISFWVTREAVGLLWDEHARLAPGSARLNDPLRVRVEPLNRLQEAGMNRFRGWRAADFRQVDRFPVFLRAAADHSGPRTELPSALVADLREELAARRRRPQSG